MSDVIDVTDLNWKEYVEEYWRRNDTRSGQGMWDSWKDPHRGQVLLAVQMLPKIKTLHEIGCGSGPNLRLLREYFPHLTLSGSEPRPDFREFAQREFPEVTDITLPSVPPLKVDAVLSVYTLAYVEDAAKVLADIHSRYLVLIEPTADVFPYQDAGMYINEKVMPCWVHDYPTLAAQAGWTTLWRWPILPHYQGLNVVSVYGR